MKSCDLSGVGCRKLDVVPHLPGIDDDGCHFGRLLNLETAGRRRVSKPHVSATPSIAAEVPAALIGLWRVIDAAGEPAGSVLRVAALERRAFDPLSDLRRDRWRLGGQYFRWLCRPSRPAFPRPAWAVSVLAIRPPAGSPLRGHLHPRERKAALHRWRQVGRAVASGWTSACRRRHRAIRSPPSHSHGRRTQNARTPAEPSRPRSTGHCCMRSPGAGGHTRQGITPLGSSPPRLCC